ncbi:MAG TPA: sulfite exporter TauE/SafE family protein [Xanthomonadaceae bacterium]|nr:sulfite exporter TauE/SafE family protein [Xanthomonadaceae bacterium]
MTLALLTCLVVGAVAGLLAGLLGVGGGLVIVPALVWLLPPLGLDPAFTMHVALATALASILFTSLSSTRAHWQRHAVGWREVGWLAPGLLLGAFAGAVFAAGLSSDTLRLVVAGFCLFAAWQLAYGRVRAVKGDHARPNGPGLSASGVGIGALSAVVGIGGGSMTVPLLVWHGVVPVRAVATSAACGFVIAVAGALGWIVAGHHAPPDFTGMLGYVWWPGALALGATSVLLAPLGARLAHALPAITLRRVFAGFLLLVALALAAPVIVAGV